MITVDNAIASVLEHLPAPRIEEIGIEQALGRVLARTIIADMDVPPFHRSAMDGYAVRSEDVRGRVPVALRVIGEVRAGGGSELCVGAGEAASIMTGAPVPAGADAVQMVERTETNGASQVSILDRVAKGSNVVPCGFEARKGDPVLESGRTLGPSELAVLATFGHARIPVWARPTVALISTGDELVEIDAIPSADQIRNSNAYSLSGQLKQLAIEPQYLGIAPDEKAELRNMIRAGLEKDVLLLTGGVSMGEYDFVTEIFVELELDIVFTKVAMRPGKPTVFARRGDQLVYGLPGNPISTYVAFENFVRPALGRMCGYHQPELPRIRGALRREMKQKRGRTSFLPAWIICEDGEWTIDPIRWKGSADIIGFSRANGMVVFPSEQDFMPAGHAATAMLFPDFVLRSLSKKS